MLVVSKVSTDSWEGINMPILKESKEKVTVKRSEGSGTETDQTEQLDVLLN